MDKKKKMPTKDEKFKKAVENFKNSEQTSVDYLELLIVSNSVTRPDAGLMYDQLEEILREVLGEDTK